MKIAPFFWLAGGLFFIVSGPRAAAQSWTVTSAPTNQWTSVASSADGSTLIASCTGDNQNGQVYLSTNSGLTWSPAKLPSRGWTCVGSSAEGTRLLAAGLGESLMTSPDAGENWSGAGTPNTNFWISIACSADGKQWGVADSRGSRHYGRVFVSTDEGGFWKDTYTDGLFLSSIACTADAAKWFLAAQPGALHTSTNSGESWQPAKPSPPGLNALASSADGTRLVGAGSGAVYTSTNSGSTWVNANLPAGEWLGAACSADGQRMVAVGRNLPIYTSTNAGVTWEAAEAPTKDWKAVASSADGCKLVAVVLKEWTLQGEIYTWQTTPSPRLHLRLLAEELTLSWIVPSLEMVLQQSPTMEPSSWVNVETTPTLNYSTVSYEVRLPNPAGPMFYRLASVTGGG